MIFKSLGLRGLRLPALPAVYYKTDWQGYEDGLHKCAESRLSTVSLQDFPTYPSIVLVCIA